MKRRILMMVGVLMVLVVLGLGAIPTASALGPNAIRSGFEDTALYRNDDGYSGMIPIGFTINFFGNNYSNVSVNNNGNLTFDSAMSTYTPFYLYSAGRVVIAPFFADVDTSNAGDPVEYQMWTTGRDTVNGRPAFGATWRNVDYYPSSSSHTNRNHFQAILIDRSDTGTGNFDIEFNYDQIQWEAGTASGGNSNGLGGSSARAGYSNGTAQYSYELPGSAVNGGFLDSNMSTGLIRNSMNSGQLGRYVFSVRGGTPNEANLAISMTDAPDPVNAGQNLTYSMTVSNTGPKDTTSVIVRDTLPAGVNFLSASVPSSISGNVVTLNLGTIANGGTASATLTTLVTSSSASSITNTATVSSALPDPVSSNNVASATTAVILNRAPVAAGDSYSTDEDTFLTVTAPGVLGNDTDADGNTLTAQLLTAPAKGIVTLNSNGSFTYTPNINANGTDSFTYKASDGSLESGAATVTVTINPVNDAPVANAGGPYSADEGSMVGFSGSATDVDEDALTYSWDFGDGNAGAGATVSHAYADNGTYTVTVTVNDGDGGLGTDTAAVTVNNVAPALAISVLDFEALPTGNFVEQIEDGFRIRYIGFGDYQKIVDVAGNNVLKDSVYNGNGAQVYINRVDGKNFYFNSLDYNNFNNNSGSYRIDVDAFPYPFNWSTVKSIQLNPTSSTFSTLTGSALGVAGVQLCQIRVNIVSSSADYSVDNIKLTAVPDEGDTFSTSGSFTDPGADTWTATVNYGDGSVAQPLTLNADKTFSLSHVYADNGTYPITVTINDGDGGVTSGTLSVTVNNVAPTVNVGPDVTINEGDIYTGMQMWQRAAANMNDSADGHNGVAVGTVTYTTGKVGQAFNFAGNGLVKIPNEASLNYGYSDFSGSLWVKTTSYSGFLMEKDTPGAGNDWFLYLSNGRPEFVIGSTSGDNHLASDVAVNDGNWHNITWGRLNNIMQLYVDGNLRASKSIPAIYLNNSMALAIGSEYNDSSGGFLNTFTGAIDEVKLFNRALSASEISFLAAGGASFTDPGVSDSPWLGTVNYGDGSATQNLTLTNDKTFVLNHTYIDNGTYTMTVTVIDKDGGSGSDTANITVNNVAPVVNAGDDQSAECCIDEVSFIGTFSDPAGSQDAIYDIQWDFGDGNIATGTLTPMHQYRDTGTYTVTLTVTDKDGGKGIDTLTVTVMDTTPPDVVTQDITVQLDASGSAAITPANVDNGSSDACGIASMTVAPNAFTCANVGANTVTLTVTDNNGNVSTATATVTVEDNVAPVAKAKNITVQLDANGQASIIAADVDNGSSDACGVTLAVSPNTFNCSKVGANTVTLTVTDSNNNVSTATATVTVEDKVAPVAIAKNITVQLDATGNVSIVAADIDNGSSDACGIASMTVSPNTFDCSNVGANTVTLTVTDKNGNVGTATATVKVEDNIAPVAQAQDITVRLDASGSAAITPANVDNGSSDACGIAGMTVSPNAFDCSDIGANTVTLTVTDNNGNVSTATATVTVEDKVVPVAKAKDITVQLDASGNASITPADVDNGSSDACGVTLAVSPSTFNCSNVGANTVTLTVTDSNNNVSTATATVTVEDKVAPVAIAKNITVQLDATGNVSIVTADVNNNSEDACGIVSMAVSPNAFSCANVGPNTVTLTVTDVNGNVSTATAIVTVEDNIAPVANAKDITVQLNASGQASITAADVDNGSSDACGVTLTVSPNVFDCSDVGTNTVMLTVTDNNGNVSTAKATATVQDKVAPVAKAKDITVQLDASGNASITAETINDGSSDACGIASMTVSPNAFDCSDIGANTVTLTVTDSNGNVSTATAIVTVKDVTPPVITAGASSLTVECDGEGNSAELQAWLATNAGASAADTCSSVTWTNNFASLSDGCGATGSAVVTFTATDAYGNTSSTTATFTIVDKVAPSITTQASDETVECDGSGNTAQLNAWLASNARATASDVCGGVIWSNNSSALSDDCGATGSATVTFTATDACGNTSSTTATFTIMDTTAPSIDIPASDLTVECDGAGNTADLQAWLASNGGAVSSDICSGVTWSNNFSALSDDCGATGSETVTFTATDACGNTSSTTATFAIVDTTAPAINQFGISGTAPYYTTQNIEVTHLTSDICGGTPNVQVTLSNNSGAMVRDITGPSPITLNLSDLAGVNTITLTATDACGNVSTATVSFEVILQLVGEQQIVIKPESLNVNPGEFTAFIVMPAPYDAVNITDAIADGAPSQKINYDATEHKAVIKFDRADITPSLLDTHFEVSGHFTFNGAVCHFVGADDIMKVDPSSGGKKK